MSYDENRISDQIDGGLHQQKIEHERKEVEDYFFKRYGNKITSSQSWVIGFTADFHQEQRRKDLPSDDEINEAEKIYKGHDDNRLIGIGFKTGVKWLKQQILKQ